MKQKYISSASDIYIFVVKMCVKNLNKLITF